MRLRLLLPLLPILVGACSSSPTDGSADCVQAVRVGGADYVLSGQASADRVGPEFTRTLRQRGCDDVIVAGAPASERWRDGDSSLAPDTPLYASLDHPTSEALIAPMGGGSWGEFRRLPGD